MKILPILAVVGLGLFVWNTAQLGLAAATIQVILQSVDISGLTSYKVTFLVQNVTNATLTVNSMTGTVTVNGNTLGNISTFTQVVVPPNSQMPIVVTINLSVLNLPSDVIAIINNNTGSLLFAATGYVNVSGVPAPIAFNVQENFTY